MQIGTQGEGHVKMQAEIRKMPLEARKKTKMSSKPRKPEERPGADPPAQPQKIGTSAPDTLILDFWPPGCERTHFCPPVVLCMMVLAD